MMTMTPAQPTRTRDQWPKSPPRSCTCSPACPSAPAMTCPLRHTPFTDDEDEWPNLNLTSSPPQLRKAPAAQRVQIHPLVNSKSSSLPNVSSATSLEFTLADQGERIDKADIPWYARELGQVFSLASPCTPSGSGASPRADSLFPLPPSRASGKAPRSTYNFLRARRQADNLALLSRVDAHQSTTTPSVLKSTKITVLYRVCRPAHRSHLTWRIFSTIPTHGPPLCAPIPTPAPAAPTSALTRIRLR